MKDENRRRLLEPSWRRLAGGYVGLAERHPFGLLIALMALSACLILPAQRLSVVTDFRSLLPDDAPSVRALEMAEARRGSGDLYTLAVQSPSPEANIAFLDKLAARIRSEWPEALWVQVLEDPTFFQDHALLYSSVERLEQFRDDLDTALDCELAEVNPLFVAFDAECGDQERDWSLEAWVGADPAVEVGLPEGFLGAWGSSPDDEREAHLGHHILSPDGTIGVIYVQLDQPNLSVEYSNRMLDRGTALIARLQPTRFHPEMRAQVVGSFRSMTDAREAVGDATSALFVSTAFVLLVLVGFFRALRSIAIVFLPLAAGVVWTLGVTGLVLPRLNLYTLFVGSVLVGLGVDFGVHLYARAREAFAEGSAWPDALVTALVGTGRAILAAALTTVGALLTLLIAHFRGFFEFGVVASYGIVLCMVAAYLVLPPLVLALERLRPLARPTPVHVGAASPRTARRRTAVAAAVVLAVALVGSVLAPRAAFEYDMRKFRSEIADPNATIPYQEALGEHRSSSPSVILGENEAQMGEVHDLLRRRLDDGDPYINGFLTLETIVPPEQEARLSVIRQIERMVNRRALNRLQGEAAEFVERVRELAAVEPFTRDDVPEWALNLLRERDGSVGRMGLLFRSVDSLDIAEVLRFERRYGAIDVESGEVPVASGAFITADVIVTVQDDGRRMAVVATIILGVVLLLSLRSVWGTVVALVTMGVAFALMLGTMVVTGTKLGIFNMIVVPAILGVSIDGAIHIFHRYRASGGDMARTLRTTGLAVLAASLTTAGGFAGLLFQDHPGIASIGRLAVIGILAALIAVLGFMPGLLTLLPSRSRRSKEAESGQRLAPVGTD